MLTPEDVAPEFPLDDARFFTPSAFKGCSLASTCTPFSDSRPCFELAIEERFITASTSSGDAGCSSPSSSSSEDGSVPLELCMERFFSGADCFSTDLNYYHSEVRFDALTSNGHFTKVKTLGSCCRGKGEVELHRWARIARRDEETVVVKRLPLSCLYENENSERNERAVHCYSRTRQMEDTLAEIGIYSFLSQQQTTSPYILKMHAALQAGEDAWLVLQHADGGDLFEVIQRKDSVSSQQALRWTWQLLQAVDFLHKRSIGHRDISIENILLRGGDVQLMDFGQAVQTHSSDGVLLRYFCALGKDYYRAPERNVPEQTQMKVSAPAGSSPCQVAFAQEGDYLCEVLLPATAIEGQECFAEPWGYTVPPIDVFACGVCSFVLVGGVPPWQQARPSDPHFAFVRAKGVMNMLRAYGKHVQPEMGQLMDTMLRANPSERVTVVDALAHPVFDSLRPGSQ